MKDTGTIDPANQFGLGCVNLGSAGRGGGVRLVHHALDVGVRYFDTADAYGAGASEQVIGRALRQRRGRAIVATKAGYLFRERTGLEQTARRLARPIIRRIAPLIRRRPAQTWPLSGSVSYASQEFSTHHLRRALEASLRRLRMDYVDLFQLHGPADVCDDDVLGLMQDLRSEGKILGFGVGLEGIDHAMDWLATGALSSIQVPFGVLDPEAGYQIIPGAKGLGVPVVVRGVFAGGFMAHRTDNDVALLRAGQPNVRTAVRDLASAAGVDPLQVAAWFATTQPGVATVLVGASSIKHLEESLRFVEARAPHDMMPLLQALVPPPSAPPATDPARGEGGAT